MLGTDHHDAVVAHEHDVRLAHAGGDAVALGLVERQAVVVLVDHGAAPELQRGLPGPDQRLAVQHRQRGRVGHVGVEGGAGARAAPCARGRGCRTPSPPGTPAPATTFPVEVADQQAGGGDLVEAPAVGVDQEQLVRALGPWRTGGCRCPRAGRGGWPCGSRRQGPRGPATPPGRPRSRVWSGNGGPAGGLVDGRGPSGVGLRTWVTRLLMPGLDNQAAIDADERRARPTSGSTASGCGTA